MLGQVRSGFQWVRLSTVSPIVISRTCAQNVALPANFETFCLQRSMDLEVIPLWIEKKTDLPDSRTCSSYIILTPDFFRSATAVVKSSLGSSSLADHQARKRIKPYLKHADKEICSKQIKP